MVQIMMSLIPQSSQRHICRVCDKTFRASSLLDIHMRVHVGAKPYVCPTCGHRATQKGNLKLHMKKHHGTDLPAHIDMVPDSGIWRDNEEVAMTELHSPLSCDSLADDPKKKKVFTQAMSSLLDPYVVELIKRCQNSVGQGMTGRITESLQDFIKVAQDSNFVKENDCIQFNNNHMDAPKSQQSTRATPTHPVENCASETIPHSRKPEDNKNELASSFLSGMPTDLELLSFYNERLNNLTLRTSLADKEEYLAYLKLYRYNALLEQRLRHKALRPVNSNEECSEFPAQFHENLGNADEKRPDGKSDSPARVSPGVLRMLRKTILNSVGQKASNVEKSRVKSNDEDKGDEQAKEISTELEIQKSGNTVCGSAMKSLADIGKSFVPYVSHGRDSIISRSPNAEKYSNSKPVVSQFNNSTSTAFKCQFCHKEYKYKSVLEIHMRSHTGERPYKCSYCEYAGTQHNCLKLHIQRHHPNEYYTHHADSLGMGKGPGLAMNQSTTLLQSSDANCRVTCLSPVNCPVCGRVSPSPGYLKIHMRSHKKSLDHVCHICGRGFKEYWYLSTHLKTHEREMTSFKVSSPSAATVFHNLLRSSPIDLNSNYSQSLSQVKYLLDASGLCVPLPSEFNGSGSVEASPQPFVPAHVIRKTCSQSPPMDCTDDKASLLGTAAQRPESAHRTSKRKSSFPTRILHTDNESNDDSSEFPQKKVRLNGKRLGEYLTPSLSKLPFSNGNKTDNDLDEEKPLDLSVRKRIVTPT